MLLEEKINKMINRTDLDRAIAVYRARKTILRLHQLSSMMFGRRLFDCWYRRNTHPQRESAAQLLPVDKANVLFSFLSLSLSLPPCLAWSPSPCVRVCVSLTHIHTSFLFSFSHPWCLYMESVVMRCLTASFVIPGYHFKPNRPLY